MTDDNKKSDMDQQDVVSEGGQSQGQNNPGNFANDPQRASDAGRKGGEASGQSRNQNQNEEQGGMIDDLLGEE